MQKARRPDAVVFVRLGSSYGADCFYILSEDEVKDVVLAHYRQFLESVGHKHPRRWDSTHTAVLFDEVEPWKDRWYILDQLAAKKHGSE